MRFRNEKLNHATCAKNVVNVIFNLKVSLYSFNALFFAYVA